MIDPRDVKVDTYTAGPSSMLLDTAVRVTHMPTGTTAEAKHVSPLKARWMAMAELERKLNADVRRDG